LTYTILPYIDMGDVFDEGKDQPAANKNTIAPSTSSRKWRFLYVPRAAPSKTYPLSVSQSIAIRHARRADDFG